MKQKNNIFFLLLQINIDWTRKSQVGRSLLELMSEGLGVGPHRLEQLTIGDGKVIVCHYYPPCPEPDATMGLVTHTDPGALTVLVQDSTGGLQVKYTEQDGKCYWVDIDPVPGALVINVGDLLQVLCTHVPPESTL